MAFTHGSKAKFWLGTKAAPTTEADISSYVLNIQMPRTTDTAETSTLGNLYKTYVPGLTDGSISLDGRYDPVIDVILSDLMGEVSVDYFYRPQGNTTGLPQYSGSAVPTNYQVTAGIGDVSSWTFQLQCTSAITRGTVP